MPLSLRNDSAISTPFHFISLTPDDSGLTRPAPRYRSRRALELFDIAEILMASGYQQIYIAGEAWISMQDYNHASAQSIRHVGSAQRLHDAEKILLQVH